MDDLKLDFFKIYTLPPAITQRNLKNLSIHFTFVLRKNDMAPISSSALSQLYHDNKMIEKSKAINRGSLLCTFFLNCFQKKETRQREALFRQYHRKNPDALKRDSFLSQLFRQYYDDNGIERERKVYSIELKINPTDCSSFGDGSFLLSIYHEFDCRKSPQNSVI